MHGDRIATSVTIAAVSVFALGCGGAPTSSLFASGDTDAGTPPATIEAGSPSVDATMPVADSAPPPVVDSAPPDPIESGPTDSGAVVDATPVADSAIPDAGPPDAAPWSPDCPASAPSASTPCTQQDLQCEYGDATWSVGCDVVVQCQNGQWVTYQPGPACTPKPGPNSPSCPATFGDVPQQQICSDLGLSCVYAQGVCDCTSLGPMQGGGVGLWSCFPESGCPFPRPRLGTACSATVSACSYEVCSYQEICTGGIWQAQQVACAGGMPIPGHP